MPQENHDDCDEFHCNPTTPARPLTVNVTRPEDVDVRAVVARSRKTLAVVLLLGVFVGMLFQRWAHVACPALEIGGIVGAAVESQYASAEVAKHNAEHHDLLRCQAHLVTEQRLLGDLTARTNHLAEVLEQDQ